MPSRAELEKIIIEASQEIITLRQAIKGLNNRVRELEAWKEASTKGSGV